MGPNGPALGATLKESLILPDSLIDSLASLGGTNFVRIFGKLRSMPVAIREGLAKFFPKVETSNLRKLSVKPDRECKSRVFAMLDYYSQTVLRPLHELLFDQLKKIQYDQTFTQADQLVLTAPEGHRFWSMDLTAATDRFPKDIQRSLIAALVGPDRASHWVSIMSGYPFHYKGKEYLYGAGQPMGAYSSWAAFTLAHHLVVFDAAMRAKVEMTPGLYAILGDDIVIANDAVAREYQNIMVNELKVELSVSKTHSSSYCYEFAKRWFYRGEEITPFPVWSLIENKDRFYLLLDSLMLAWERGYPAPCSWQPDRVFRTCLEALGFKGRQVPYLLGRIQALWATPRREPECQAEFGARANAFFRALGLELNCAWSSSYVVRLWTLAMASAFDTASRENEQRLQDKLESYESKIEEYLEDAVQGQDDQSWRDELVSLLPPIASLVERMTIIMEESQGDEELELVSIWDRGSLFDVTPLPSLSGIQPERAHHRRLGARSHWILTASRLYKRRELPYLDNDT